MQTRELPLSQFRKQYPEDFQTAAIAEIGEKFATLQHELVKQLPQATSRATRTSTKRAAEPETVLRTTRRRAAVQAQAVVINDGCLASYTTEDASECRGTLVHSTLHERCCAFFVESQESKLSNLYTRQRCCYRADQVFHVALFCPVTSFSIGMPCLHLKLSLRHFCRKAKK